MILGQQGGPRLDPWDRQAVEVSLEYAFTILAPHAATVRATITINSISKAKLEATNTRVYRNTVAAPASGATGYANIANINGSNVQVNFNATNANVPGDETIIIRDHDIILLPGTTFFLATYDNSTGGTCGYSLAAQIYNFAA